MTYTGESIRWLEGAWIWSLRAHPRVCLFIWKVAWGRLLIRALLWAQGMDISPIYPDCGQEEESIDHVLFRCARAVWVWQLARILPTVTLGERSGHIFLEAMRWSTQVQTTRLKGIRVAYMAYQI